MQCPFALEGNNHRHHIMWHAANFALEPCGVQNHKVLWLSEGHRHYWVVGNA